MTPLGNYLLARAMFLQIASKLAVEAGRPTQPGGAVRASEQECEQLLAFTGHDRWRITMEMLQRLQRPPFTNQLNYSDHVMRLTIQTEAPAESPDETAAQYEWAIRKNPDDRVLRYNSGLFLFDHDRSAAFGQLRMSRPWDSFPVFAPDGTLVE